MASENRRNLRWAGDTARVPQSITGGTGFARGSGEAAGEAVVDPLAN